jgi:acetyl-CoA hydrolase
MTSATLSEVVDVLLTCRRVYFGGTCSLPVAVLDALEAQRHRFGELEIVFGYLLDRPSIVDRADAPFRFVTLQPSAAIERDLARGRMQYIPTTYSQIATVLSAVDQHPIDALVVQVSRPLPDGRVCLGLSNGPLAELVRATPIVIGQVNRTIPQTLGSEVDASCFDLFVELDAAPLELATPPAGDVVTAVARRIAELVTDGCTIQLGVGNLPSEVVRHLAARRGLRFRTGLIGDSVAELCEAGALAATTDAMPPIVTAEVVGSAALFKWVARNPDVRVVGSDETHRRTDGHGDAFVAVNSALEVALDGAVNAEWLGGRQVSGAGGLPDFAHIALACAHGRSIIGLRSSSAEGSRIVTEIGPGRVTLAPYLADTFVTEHGTASVRGVPLPDRVELIRGLVGRGDGR